MGIVSDAVFYGPLFHTSSHCIGHTAIQMCAIIHHVEHFLKDILRKVFVHLLAIKHLFTKEFTRAFCRSFYVNGLLFEGFTDNLKS